MKVQKLQRNFRDASGFLNSLGIETPLVGPLLIAVYQVNKIVNELLLAEDKFMTEMNLRQPGFTCSACGSFTRN